MNKTILNTKEELKQAILAAKEQYDDFNDKYDYSSITDMSYLLANCKELKTIPYLDTSNVTDMSSMFDGCKSLKEIPYLNTSNVKDMSYMLYGCKSLLEIPHLDTSKVISMYRMLADCSSLVEIPNFNISKVGNMNKILNGCTSLKTIPKFDFNKFNIFEISGGTKNIIDMYLDDIYINEDLYIDYLKRVVNTKKTKIRRKIVLTTKEELRAAIIYANVKYSEYNYYRFNEVFDYSSINDFSELFKHCEDIYEIPLLDTKNVTNMDSMFESCLNLKKVAYMDLTNVKSAKNMFKNCYNLEDTSSLVFNSDTNLENCYFGCYLLKQPLIIKELVKDKFYKTFRYCNIKDYDLYNENAIKEHKELDDYIESFYSKKEEKEELILEELEIEEIESKSFNNDYLNKDEFNFLDDDEIKKTNKNTFQEYLNSETIILSTLVISIILNIYFIV